MPLIRATLMENAISAEQKQELLGRITDAVVSVYGENMRPYTWVLIDDIKSGLWGVGGHGLTTSDVQSAMAGTPSAA